MQTTNDFWQRTSILVAEILTLVALGLSIWAIIASSWQVVNLREYNSIHEHGLWLDCTRHNRDGPNSPLSRRYATITEPLHCVYKFDYDKYSGTFDLEDDNSPVGEVNRHKFYGWHTATLILLGLALLTAFLSICIGFCACCYGSLALIFTTLTLVTTFLSAVALGLFFFYSHRADNRFIKGIVGTYEQRVGLAFYLQMAACFLHFAAFIVSLLFSYFALTRKSNLSDRYSLPKSSKTNITNVGRSMEFMPQTMYQQNLTTSNVRPPYYTKQQTQYDKTVAESMPELGATHSSSEIITERVRRKSETCV